MKLIRSNPSALSRFSDYDAWFRHPFAGFPSLNHLFSGFGELLPCAADDRLAVDVSEDKEAYLASFEVPGVKKEDVKIELNDGLLSVSAERHAKHGEGSVVLTRSVSLPDGVNADAISAKLEDGILRVTLPKAEHSKPRSIALN